MFRFIAIFLLIFNLSTAYEHGSHMSHRFARRGPSDSRGLEKRSDRFTWYATGLGACGTTNSPTDYVVAMSVDDWADGTHCYEEITITYGGISVQAQIVDECTKCSSGELDFSHGLFSVFASPEEVGTIYGTWAYDTGSTTTSKATTTTTSTSSTSTSTKHSTTETLTSTTSSQPTSSTTSSSTTSFFSSSSSSSPSSSPPTTSASVTASASPTLDLSGVFGQITQAYIQMANMLVAGSKVT